LRFKLTGQALGIDRPADRFISASLFDLHRPKMPPPTGRPLTLYATTRGGAAGGHPALGWRGWPADLPEGIDDLRRALVDDAHDRGLDNR